MHLRTSLPSLLALGALAGATAAQSGASGSENHVSSARNAPSAGGSSASPGFLVESELGHATAGPEASSTNFSFVGGATFTGPGFAPSTPVAFSVQSGQGPAAGGQAAEVLGVGFASPTAGTTQVDFDGLAAGNVFVVSDTRLSLLTPPGTSLLGNPKASVDVVVLNDDGSSSLSDGYLYTPALLERAPALIGGTLELDVVDEPGSFHLLAYGFALPGFGIPLNGFAGSLELITGTSTFGALTPSPSGTTQFAVPVPDQPAIVGKSLDWQVISISSLAPFAGSFSNLLSTTFGA